MLGSTLFAMGENLIRFAPGGASPDKVLFVVGGVLMLLGVWLLVETAVSLGRPLREAAGENDPR
jgi:hypothetical protein